MSETTTNRVWSKYTFKCVSCGEECYIDKASLLDTIEDADPQDTIEFLISGYEYCLDCVADEQAVGEKVKRSKGE